MSQCDSNDSLRDCVQAGREHVSAAGVGASTTAAPPAEIMTFVTGLNPPIAAKEDTELAEATAATSGSAEQPSSDTDLALVQGVLGKGVVSVERGGNGGGGACPACGVASRRLVKLLPCKRVICSDCVDVEYDERPATSGMFMCPVCTSSGSEKCVVEDIEYL